MVSISDSELSRAQTDIELCLMLTEGERVAPTFELSLDKFFQRGKSCKKTP